MTARRVLVVDDLQDTATSLAFLLAEMGHEAKFATDPVAAVEVARSFKPEIALLDIGMPKLDGWRLGRLLKSEPGLESLRVFAITGYATTADHQRSMDAGFEDHFTKPVDIRLLESLFRSMDHA